MDRLVNKQGEEYLIYGDGYFPLSSNIFSALREMDSSPDIMYWDDLIVTYDSFLNPRLEIISLNLDDTYLLDQLELKTKVAIKKSFLAKNKYTASAIDLAIIFKNLQTKKIKLNGVFRFIDDYQKAFVLKKRLKPSQKAKSVSIIVNYRDGLSLMESFLSSLAQQKISKRVELLLVNNQSKEEIFSDVKKRCQVLLDQSINVKHIIFDEPFNHSAQNNLAAKHAQGEVFLFINNDAYFIDNDVVEQISDWALEPNIATAGVSILGANQRVVSTGIAVSKNNSVPGEYIVHETDRPFLLNFLHETAGNTFACAAVSRTVWEKVGGLNAKQFPTQYNDADFNLKCLEFGYKNIAVGYLKVFHEPGASEQRNKLKLREDHRNLLSLHQQVANFHGRELTSKPVAWKDVKFNFRLSFFLVVLMLLERFNFNLLRVKRKIRSLWK